jgi:hypothetical protein
MKMRARFPIGFEFEKKRVPKEKFFTSYRIDDVLVTRSVATDEIVRIEYRVSHVFLGQRIPELMVDTTIARSLSNEKLAEFA